MKVHGIASAPHYAEHIEAIHRHLPDSMKGEMRVGRYAKDIGWDPEDLVMIAGFSDFERCLYHRIIFVEHGAGQSYVDINQKAEGYYHGAKNHPPRVIAYLCPRQEVADKWDKPAYVIRAPVCDPHPLAAPGPPMAAITFHWDAARVCPEAATALPHYADYLGDLVRLLQHRGFRVLAHHHPRDPFLPHVWRKLGLEPVDVNTVREHASLLIADNTSLQWEMAYLNRANVVLNAPWYRRDVEHGLRFWNPPGPMVDSPTELMELISEINVGHDINGSGTPAYDQMWSDGSDGLRAAGRVTLIAADN